MQCVLYCIIYIYVGIYIIDIRVIEIIRSYSDMICVIMCF